MLAAVMLKVSGSMSAKYRYAAIKQDGGGTRRHRVGRDDDLIAGSNADRADRSHQTGAPRVHRDGVFETIFVRPLRSNSRTLGPPSHWGPGLPKKPDN